MEDYAVLSLKSLTLRSRREATIILSFSPLETSGFCTLKSNKTGLIKSNVSWKQVSASPSKIINGMLCLGRLDAGQRAEPAAELTQTNSAAQSYQIPVLAVGEFKHIVPREGGGKGGGGGRVIEEVRQRSMFDTALILLLSVKRFQHSNNTGP